MNNLHVVLHIMCTTGTITMSLVPGIMHLWHNWLITRLAISVGHDGASDNPALSN